MNSFVLFENIRRFKALLAQRLEPEQRHTVEDLLAEEEANLAETVDEQISHKSPISGPETRPD